NYNQNWSPYAVSHQLKAFENYLLSLAKKNQLKYQTSRLLKAFDKGRILSPFPYSGWELEKWMPGYESFVKELFQNLIAFKYQANWPGEAGLKYKNELFFTPFLTKEQLAEYLVPFLDKCVGANLKLQKKDFFVEDNTWSILFADKLFDLFPNSKLIHVLRDPRDVVASLLKQRWTPNEFEHVVVWYESIMKKWMTLMPKLDSNRVLEIRLEDLIANTSKTVELMCAFSGLSFEETMLTVKLNKSNTGRYKTELTEAQIHFLESRLKPILAHYNY
ncbi:MAG: sulfotransferase family protein, partial [Flavobacteriales bacterium]